MNKKRKIKAIITTIIIIISVLVLSGCSSKISKNTLYEGELWKIKPEGEVSGIVATEDYLRLNNSDKSIIRFYDNEGKKLKPDGDLEYTISEDKNNIYIEVGSGIFVMSKEQKNKDRINAIYKRETATGYNNMKVQLIQVKDKIKDIIEE